MRKILVVSVLLSACLLIFSAFKHPFYLSVTDLKYSGKDKTLQGSVKIFVNDLEVAFKKIYNKPIDLINIKDSLLIRDMSEKYLINNLNINVNGKKIGYAILGYEQHDEAFWIYLETQKCAFPKQVTFTNTILYQDFPQQMNIIHLEVDKNRQSTRLINPDSQTVLNF